VRFDDELQPRITRATMRVTRFISPPFRVHEGVQARCRTFTLCDVLAESTVLDFHYILSSGLPLPALLCSSGFSAPKLFAPALPAPMLPPVECLRSRSVRSLLVPSLLLPRLLWLLMQTMPA